MAARFVFVTGDKTPQNRAFGDAAFSRLCAIGFSFGAQPCLGS